MGSNCAACGETIVYGGRGRPRRYCETCVPSGSGGGAWQEAWLKEHRDELEAKRLEAHAARMAEWRTRLKQTRATMAANRRRAEQKSRKVA
jgi:hypothetical protein